MTRHKHDNLGKEVCKLWLSPLGAVKLDARIAGESRHGDLLFVERHHNPTHRRHLGLLGKLACGTVLFELFRNAPSLDELASCIAKRIELRASALRKSRRKKQSASEAVQPLLCIVVPSLSAKKKRALGVDTKLGGGVYGAAPVLCMAVVVVGELAETAETLWARLLGRGEVQRRAIDELLERDEHDEVAGATMRLVAAWREEVVDEGELSEEEREELMNWQQVYVRWEKKVTRKARLEGKAEGKAEGLAEGKAEGLAEGKAEGLAEGKAEGLAEGEARGKAEAVLAVLRARGLSVSATQEQKVLACRDEAQLARWLELAVSVQSTAQMLSPSRKRSG